MKEKSKEYYKKWKIEKTKKKKRQALCTATARCVDISDCRVSRDRTIQGWDKGWRDVVKSEAVLADKENEAETKLQSTVSR